MYRRKKYFGGFKANKAAMSAVKRYQKTEVVVLFIPLCQSQESLFQPSPNRQVRVLHVLVWICAVTSSNQCSVSGIVNSHLQALRSDVLTHEV